MVAKSVQKRDDERASNGTPADNEYGLFFFGRYVIDDVGFSVRRCWIFVVEMFKIELLKAKMFKQKPHDRKNCLNSQFFSHDNENCFERVKLLLLIKKIVHQHLSDILLLFIIFSILILQFFYTLITFIQLILSIIHFFINIILSISSLFKHLFTILFNWWMQLITSLYESHFNINPI